MEPTTTDNGFDDSDLFDEESAVSPGTDFTEEAEVEDAELQLQRMRAMRADLAQYDLEAEDLELLSQGDDWSQPDLEYSSRPVVAVIGRPNVGKSTLVNRVLGRREAVVQDTPGVTRDRVLYDAEWAGVDFVLVDTGGWEVDVKGLDRQIAEQAEVAIDLADVIIFVVDANVGATSTDEQVVHLLRKSGKPVILAANKADSSTQESDVTALWSLGLGEPYAISALHGRGAGDMLDAVVRAMPEESAHPTKRRPSAIRRIALVGRPNVGKSSLLNALAGETRAVVHDLAGTTRDPIDEIVEIEGRQWEFIDTAGIKRRLHRTSGADYYASIRTQAALERAEIALVLVDASVPLTEQDVRVIQQAVDAGRGIVIVNNKWDLVDDEQRVALMKQEERELVQVDWAPSSICPRKLPGMSTGLRAPSTQPLTVGRRASPQDASTPSLVASLLPIPIRYAAASNRAFSSGRRLQPLPHASSSLQPVSWTLPTDVSFSDVCGRSLALKARRSNCRFACENAAAGRAEEAESSK